MKRVLIIIAIMLMGCEKPTLEEYLTQAGEKIKVETANCYIDAQTECSQLPEPCKTICQILNGPQ